MLGSYNLGLTMQSFEPLITQVAALLRGRCDYKDNVVIMTKQSFLSNLVRAPAVL